MKQNRPPISEQAPLPTELTDRDSSPHPAAVQVHRTSIRQEQLPDVGDNLGASLQSAVVEALSAEEDDAIELDDEFIAPLGDTDNAETSQDGGLER